MIYLVLERYGLRIDKKRFLCPDGQEPSHGRRHVRNHVCIYYDLVISVRKCVQKIALVCRSSEANQMKAGNSWSTHIGYAVLSCPINRSRATCHTSGERGAFLTTSNGQP